MKLWRYGIPLERLGERYRLEGVLGSGGMADVCLAWDERDSCEVAVKVIKDNELDQQTVDRFLKEASQVARWRHPHILRIFGNTRMQVIDRSNGSMVPYIVMEFAQNGDLHKRLCPGSPFAFAETLVVFEQLCHAVSYAHSQGMIHRDLKPLNILFRALPDGSEQAVLSDFGLAVEKDATHFTFAAGGTLPYMAPEQLQGRVEQASDIFSLGVILYQLCTGRLPFRRSIVDLRRQDPLPSPRLPSTLFLMLPPDLDAVILQALAEDPRQRYADALDFWNDIQAVVSATTIHAITRHQLRHSSASWPSHGSLGTPAADNGTPDDIPPAYGADRAYTLDVMASQNSLAASDNIKELESRPDRIQSASPDACLHSHPTRSPGPQTHIPTRTSHGPNSSSDRSSGTTAKSAQPTIQSRYSRRWRISIATTALILLGLLSFLVAPLILNSLHAITSTHPGTTITLVPNTYAITENYILQSVASNPDPQKLQITTHTLTTEKSQTQTVIATGHIKTQALIANGTLTFINGASIPQSVAAGTIFTAKDGTKFTNDTTIVIPASDIPVKFGKASIKSHALDSGDNGNIPALAINQNCCIANGTVTVRNQTAFSGGQDAQDYVFVRQGDVDTTVNQIKPDLMKQALAALNTNVLPGEQLDTNNVQCSPKVHTDQLIGDHGKNIASSKVTVTLSCSGTSYQQKALQQLVTQHIMQRASQNPGADYKLQGTITTTLMPRPANVDTTDLLPVQTRGTWIYQVGTQQQQQILHMVAGKSIAEAKNIIKQQKGIVNVFIKMEDNQATSLPANPTIMTIQVQSSTGTNRE